MRHGDRPVHQTGAAMRSLVERDAAAFFHQSTSTPCVLAVRKAQGIWIEDVNGHRFMDFHGNSCHHLGYGHPRLIAALKEQLDDLTFTPRRFTDEPAVVLAERLATLWPGTTGKTLFAPGGTDAVEMAVKYAKVATGRGRTLSFHDSFHGSGYGAVSIGGRPGDRDPRIGPLLPGAIHVPSFYGKGPGAGPTGAGKGEHAEACLAALRSAFDSEDDIAALVAEPVRSTPHVPPNWFWPQVRALCDAHGAKLIFDEIPTGLGKTGKLFVSEHFEVVPDITVLGKALGGAVVPIAAMVGDASLDVASDLPLGHYTHEKNPFTCRAALTVLEVIESEGLVGRAAVLGAWSLNRVLEIASTHAVVREARGCGLLMSFEFRDDWAVPAGDIARSVMVRCLDNGLSVSTAEGNAVTLSPPLIITRSELDQALTILEEAIGEASKACH